MKLYETQASKEAIKTKTKETKRLHLFSFFKCTTKAQYRTKTKLTSGKQKSKSSKRKQT